MNAFTQALTSKNARTQNNALSNSSSGSLILDYFYNAGSYRGRNQEDVATDMASIFGENPTLALKTVFYNRLITRRPYGLENVQRGQGQKDEFIKSLYWLEQNHPDYLYENLHLVPVVGCWKDLWYDSPSSKYYHYINQERVYELVRRTILTNSNVDLLAKFLPKIRSARNVKNERHQRLNVWARALCQYLGWTERDYRKFKSDPHKTAHEFQRKMCARDWDNLDFKRVPGKALFKLVNGKGKDGQSALIRHKQDKRYLEWLDKQPTAKFTGYVYELYKAARGQRDLIKTTTYNKQFEQLLKVAKEDVNPELLSKGVLCALDTSGSMSINVTENAQAVDICVGLGIFFSSLLEGYFHDHVVMFDDRSKILKLKGNFCEKVDQIARAGVAWGSTNFQSVIDEIVRVRKQNPQIPVSEYPQVLLVVSDMQFNPVGGYGLYSASQEKTNYEQAMAKLQAVGLPKMTVIWWQVNGAYGKDVPSTMTDEGTVLISGFDPSIVTTILGGEVKDEKTGEVRKLNPYESMVKALDQEILNLLKV